MEQVVENHTGRALRAHVESASHSGVGILSPEELAVIDHVREQYQALRAIPCTHCEYCLPCPSGVAIPDVFEIYNDLLIPSAGDNGRARLFYSWIEEEKRAQACIECGECLEKCPQGIKIPEWLKKVHEALCQEGATPA
jgi:uncharacterized protein